jgi:hypothetical protein
VEQQGWLTRTRSAGLHDVYREEYIWDQLWFSSGTRGRIPANWPCVTSICEILKLENIDNDG